MNRSTEIGSLVVNVSKRSKRQRDMERYRMREESKREKRHGMEKYEKFKGS